MKKTLTLIIILLLISEFSFAQSITLSPSTPGSPVKGTVVFDNATNLLKYWNGTVWIPITNAASGTGWALNGTHINNNNTGNVGIGTSTPKAPFNVGAGKSVLFGADSTGTGSRLVWYSGKAAFRAGYYDGVSWDYADVGDYSIAMGRSARAKGTNSTALGGFTNSVGSYSIALGNTAVSIGNGSTALGYYANSTGETSVSIGNTTKSVGSGSVAIGHYTTATANFSTALGIFNADVPGALFMLGNGTGYDNMSNALTVMMDGKTGIGTTAPKATFNVGAGKTVLFGADTTGSGSRLIWYPSKSAFRVGYADGGLWDYGNVGIYSTAMGYGTNAGAFCTALGYNTSATGFSYVGFPPMPTAIATAMGYATSASGLNSTAMGKSTTASGENATVMGYNNTASGMNATAMGSSTTASGTSSTTTGGNNTAGGNYSTAIGNFTQALGTNSLSGGLSTIANGNNSTALGNNTKATAINSMAIGTYNTDVANSLLMVGNGTGVGSLSNALTVMADGKVGIGTTIPLAPLHIAGSNVLNSGHVYYFFVDYSSAAVNYLSSGSWATGLLVEKDIIGKQSIVSGLNITTSDARIKNIIGLSNNQQDLETLKKLQITDYRYKDKVTWGNQTFKKVIAQQVEEVYPQAVRKQTSTIPDIYSLAEKVVYDETNKTLTVTLARNYNIKTGDKIEVVHPEKGKVQAMVELVSGNSFTLKDWQYPTDKLFVFGREVNDFRAVDYEGLSMLGISAIQQLAKENEELKSKLNLFSARLEAIEALLVKPQTGN